MRKILFSVPAAVLALTAFTGDVSAQEATVTYEVTGIEEMALSGNPLALVINTAAKLKDGVTDIGTTWDVTSNKTNTKVTGMIKGTIGMPDGLTLTVKLAGPALATSTAQALTITTAAELVAGITEVQEYGLGVTYTLKAAPTAGVVASANRTIVYTISAGT